MTRAPLRQLVVGLLALPLSLLPFIAYCTLTPEGRLVRDKVVAWVRPPDLPRLSDAQRREAAAIVPTYGRGVTALVYHGLGSGSDGEGGYVMTATRFGEHLAALKAAGMQVVTAADIAWSMATGTPLPDRAVMISFDDGRTDALLWADPLLEQAGMKATMFVISETAAKPSLYYAGWDRLRAAARSGRWDIEAHSHEAHRLQRVESGEELPALTSLAPGESLAEYQARVQEDLERNSAAIQAHIGQRPVAFAYPFGAYGAERANDPAIEEILRNEVANRFVIAFHQDGQDTVPLIDPSQSRIGLRRLSIGNWSGTDLLRRIAKVVADSAPAGPLAESDPVTKTLPPIPFVPELEKRPGPSILAAPGTTTTVAPATTTTVLPPRTTAPPTTGPSTTTGTSPPTTRTTGPSSTTSTRPPTTATTTTRPPTTTTRPPTTTSTTRPPTTTTTTRLPPSSTTTTTRPCHDNRDSCKRLT